MSTTTLPRFRRGVFAFRGVVPLDTEYCDEDDRPLLTAAQAQAVLGIRQRTVYEWRRRKYLEVVGLTEDGRELYDAAELEKVRSSPSRRAKIAA